MFEVLGIDHVVLRVSDMERALRFYVDVLGCPLEREVTEFGLFQLRAGRSLIDLVDVAGPLGKSGGPPPSGSGANMDHFCIRIEPFNENEIRQHLEFHGIDCGKIEYRYGADGDGPAIYIKDPEGNTVELKGSGGK